MKKKISILLILSLIFVASHASAESISDIRERQIEQGILELVFATKRIDTIETDMYLYVGWMPEEKEKWRNAAKKSIIELTNLKIKVRTMNLPADLRDEMEELISIIEYVTQMYDGIEEKSYDTMADEYEDYSEMVGIYRGHLAEEIENHMNVQQLSHDFSYEDVIISDFKEKSDQELFLKAGERIVRKEYVKAYTDLKLLREKYQGQPAEGAILMMMATCADDERFSEIKEYGDSNIKIEHPLEFYTEIVNSGRYSPVLNAAYIRWRTQEQTMNHGMSNYSNIPNRMYNDKRRQVVEIIQKYLKENPDDAWAKHQMLQIMDIPNIERGGPFGNSNIIYYGRLFMDLEEQE